MRQYGYERRGWTTQERNRIIRREHKVNVRCRALPVGASIMRLAKQFKVSTKTIEYVIYRLGKYA